MPITDVKSVQCRCEATALPKAGCRPLLFRRPPFRQDRNFLIHFTATIVSVGTVMVGVQNSLPFLKDAKDATDESSR